jgi:hypothetical protein
MQSFFGKINFVRKFTPDFAKTIKPLQNMIHKDVDFKWDDEEKDAFNNIKTAISQAQCCEVPTLANIVFSILFPPTNL